jgi:AbiV family abortive infection protein
MDAATLLAGGSFPTAASLAILSIEEAAKFLFYGRLRFRPQRTKLLKRGKIIGRTHGRICTGFFPNSQPVVLASSMIFRRYSTRTPITRSF